MMASLNIHLAIGKRYLEKNNSIKNEEEFYRGIIEPDIEIDKNKSHYTSCLDKTNLKYYLSKRTDLYKFLYENEIDNDYNLGIFIHLVTDYLFFNIFFENKYIESIDINSFNNDLYHSYDNTDEYIVNKYNLDFPYLEKSMNEAKERARKKKNTIYENGKDILPLDNLGNFITYVSEINIYKYKNKILKNKENVLP